MPKFKVGDRIRIKVNSDNPLTIVGEIGTVLDESIRPWVRFDNYFIERINNNSRQFSHIPLGYLAAVSEDCAELLTWQHYTRGELEAEIARLQAELAVMPREPMVRYLTRFQGGEMGIVAYESPEQPNQDGTAVKFVQVI